MSLDASGAAAAAAAARRPKKCRHATDPTTHDEAQAVLDAKAPSKTLQRQIDAYRLCGGCQARDALHADASRIVTMLSSLATSSETSIDASTLYETVSNDCHDIVRELLHPPINFQRNAFMAEIDAIQRMFTLCDHTEIRRELQIEHPLRVGHFGAGAARFIASAMPHQAVDVVHLIVSYIDIGEMVNPPAANEMFRVYADHMCRFLQAQQARLAVLDANAQVPRHLVDLDRIVALHSIHAVVLNASIICRDARYAAHVPELERGLTVHMHLLRTSLACKHTTKQASEMRLVMEQYASDLRAERARLCSLGFEVSATSKLAELV